ncbi:transient receptor potential cation channel protein painless-like [Bradysia coprophila]|uniref:transient receptor potential cation channel protein painless-like n=1 Tax=Bradysia coprophila TaxID=38358 RepID=UPI00187D8A93|nr:transient receptor potential cation channel protein painless-like [Bradysia coprophila]
MEKCQDSVLEELEVFRWRLYIAKDEGAEERTNLFEEACSKQISELFIEECLIARCDTNTLSNEAKVMVKKLLHKGDMLPSIQRNDDKFWDLSRLRMCLLYGNEPLFIRGITMIARKNPIKLQEQIIANSSDLLNIAASGHLTLTIETLISYGGKVEYPAFLAACKTGSWQSLETLMPHLDLEENKMPLLRELSIAARNADEKDSENFEKCYDLLLNGSEFDVNSMDSHGRSAMFYVSHLPKKIDQFLEMGTYVGMQNGTPTPNVLLIAPAALEAHFNNCVNFVQSEDNKKVTYLEFDYRNLIAPRKLEDDDSETEPVMMPNEMTAIEFISQSVDYQHLLIHPLIWSFISMKWRQMTLIRNIDCALYLLFALSNLGYVISLYGKAPAEITTVFFFLNTNLTFYVGIRRIVHLLFCSDEYRKTMINIFHTYQTIQVIVSVTLVKYLEDIDPVVPAMCVLLITCELFVLAGSIFWTFSLYYVMFLSIAWSSLKSLMVYVVLLPSFIISYWLMMNNKRPIDNTYRHEFFDYMHKALMANSSDAQVNNSQLEYFKKNFFEMVPQYIEDRQHEDTAGTVVSIMNAIIGWHRSVDDKIAIVDWTFLGLLIVMISLVSIINMNLVSSLAVTGTQAIQSKSELTCLTQRVHLLVQYEDSLTNRKHWFWQTFQNTIIMRLFDFFIQFDVLETVRQNNQRKIYIGPDNEIIYHIQSQTQSAKSGDVGIVSKLLFSPKKGDGGPYADENEESTGCCSQLWKKFIGIFFNKTDRMNPIIVENARNVIDRRKDDLNEKNDENSHTTCIHHIERLESTILALSKKVDLIVK